MPDPTLWLLAFLLLVLVAGGVLGRRRLISQRRLERRIVELETLGRVGRALVEAQLDPQALYELIYQQAGQIIDTSTFQLGLLEGDQYHIVIWVRDGVRQDPDTFDIGETPGLVGWVSRERTPLLIHDYKSEWKTLPAQPRYMSNQPPRSAIFIPLITGSDCIGVLAAQSFSPNAFSQDDVQRLSIVAHQAASAISNARFHQQVQTRAAQLELVSQVSRRVRALMPLPDLFHQTVQLIQSTFGYYCVSIYTHDSVTGELDLRASSAGEITQTLQQPPARQGLVNWSVTHQATARVNDVSADPRYLPLSTLPDTRSEMVIPLMVENEVLGALDIQSDQPRAFGPDDQFATEALADQVALAIQEARLYRAEQQQRAVAETLQQVSQTLTSSLELQTVLDTILTGLGQVLFYDAAAILLIEAENRVIVRAAKGLPSVAAVQGQRFSLDQSLRLARLADSDEPIIFEAHDPTGHYHAQMGIPADHACLGAPLVARGELIGFLTVDALPPNDYDAQDASVIDTFANQAAVAIDNARLFALLREEAWVSAALLQVAETTASFSELDEVIASIAHLTVGFAGVDRCGILLWNEEGSSFQGMELVDQEDRIDEFTSICLPPGAWLPLDRLHEQKQPVFVSGGEALSGLPNELFDFFGLASWMLLLPLVSKEELLGVMLTSGETAETDFSRQRIQLISGITYQATLAIQNAQLFASQQEEAYVNMALLQVAEVVNSLDDLADILTTIVRLAPLLIGVEHCIILYCHAGQPERSFAIGPSYGLGPEQLDEFQRVLVDPSVNELLDELQLSKVPTGAGRGYQRAVPQVWHELLDTESVVVFPLVTRRELMGAMLVSLPPNAAPLGSRPKNILTGISHQASIAIESDQLYAEAVERERMERELEVAREIQSSFLPNTRPDEAGWSVGTLWQAARQVGGDFFDFFPLAPVDEHKRWGVVIADVADKGVPAALYMALSRTLIRTVGMSRIDPAGSLERVNTILLNDSRSDLFVTVIYALWEPESNTITYTNAGHNPPLCIRASGEIEVLRDNNIVLGVLPEVHMDNHHLDLAPGESLVLYTDGITDALNAEMEEFGLDRLEAVVYGNRSASAPDIVAAISEAMGSFVGETAPFDDVTLVVIKREQGTLG